MWKQFLKVVGIGWAVLGMAISAQASSVQVYDLFTHAPVPASEASIDVTNPAIDQQTLNFSASAVIQNVLALSTTATVFNWAITTPGSYMANVFDLSVQATGGGTLTVSNMADLTDGTNSIPTLYAQRTDPNLPSPEEFRSAASLNGSTPLPGGSVFTSKNWMALALPVALPPVGTYTDTFTITIGPLL